MFESGCTEKQERSAEHVGIGLEQHGQTLFNCSSRRIQWAAADRRTVTWGPRLQFLMALPLFGAAVASQ